MEDCKLVVEKYYSKLSIRYFYKPNSGPGDSRNYGMNKAHGDYFIFFDSDCLIPESYFEEVEKALQIRSLDAFGGPDNAHDSFSNVQKAINYAMTSMITTGGIRGGKKPLDSFQPRSFNMGISRNVYHTVGGFSTLHPGEDPDLSYRIQNAGFKTGLIPEAWVFHKRRIDFGKFRTQVYKFGLARTILMLLHPQSKKLVYALPTLAFLSGLTLLLAGFRVPYLWWPLGVGMFVILVDAFMRTGNLLIAWQGLFATGVQVIGYGWGFLKGYWHLHVLGKDPKKQFPEMYFDLPSKEE